MDLRAVFDLIVKQHPGFIRFFREASGSDGPRKARASGGMNWLPVARLGRWSRANFADDGVDAHLDPEPHAWRCRESAVLGG